MTAVLPSADVSPPPKRPPQESGSPKYLNAKGCGARYAFSWRHWLRLVDAGRAPQPTRFGRLTRWSIASLESWEASGCSSCRKGAGR